MPNAAVSPQIFNGVLYIASEGLSRTYLTGIGSSCLKGISPGALKVIESFPTKNRITRCELISPCNSKVCPPNQTLPTVVVVFESQINFQITKGLTQTMRSRRKNVFRLSVIPGVLDYT